MITITGATGALNAMTVDHLLQHLPADELVIVARDVARAERFARAGVEVRRGDYADAASLPAAFAGADQLLLVSSNDPTADAVALHRAAIEAASAVGVGRILYTSHQAAALDNPFGPGHDHAATEELLAASGVAWTSLRNGFYAHSLQWLAGPWRETGVISVPGDGPVSWTAREDVAEAAAAIILRDGDYDGPVTLTAAQAPTFAELAELASRATGRDIRCEVVDEDTWSGERTAAGEGRSDFMLGFYRAASRGYFAGVDPVLGELLGREPRTVHDHLQ